MQRRRRHLHPAHHRDRRRNPGRPRRRQLTRRIFPTQHPPAGKSAVHIARRWSAEASRQACRGMFMLMSSDDPASAEEIFAACEKALLLAPAEYPPTLPPSKDLSGAPEWYAFEHKAWPIGESIRRAFVHNPKLRTNGYVVDKVLEVASCRNLRRGRQSFIMALGFVAARQHAKTLSLLLCDQDVDGHALDTLIKMKAPGFAPEVEPLLRSDKTWICNLAKKYLSRYGLPSF
jgi:hypothetical protein